MSTYLCYPVETKYQETEQMASSALWPPHTPSKKKSTYTIYIGKHPGRPQGTAHISNFICPEVQPLTRWNAAAIQDKMLHKLL